MSSSSLPVGRKNRPRWLIATLSAVAVIAVLVGWQEWRGWPWLAKPLAERLSDKLHHPVAFDKGFRLTLLGHLRLQVGELTVGQPQWMGTQTGMSTHMVKASDAKLVVPYGGLLRALHGRSLDEVVIDEISVGRLEGAFLRDQSGRANWSLDPSGKAPVTPPSSKPATLPDVRKLVVRQGQLKIQDEKLALDMDVQASTSEGEEGNGLVVKGEGKYRRNAFVMEAKSAGLLPLLTHTDQAPPIPIVIRAEAGRSRVSFQGQTRDLLGLKDLEGELALKGPSLAAIGDAVGVTLPTTAVFDLAGRLKKSGDVWNLQIKQLAVGDSRLGGNFTLDRRPAVPFLEGELSGSNLALADLAPAFGAQAPGAANPAPPRGRLLPQREFDVPSLRAMDAKVALRIKQASLGSLFARPLSPLEADLTLKSGVLSLNNVLARTAGGSFGGAVQLDGRGDKLLWDAKLKWSEIKLEQWLSMPRTDKPRAENDNKKEDRAEAKPKPAYVTGEMAGNADLKGEGNSTALLLASLDGHATTWVRDGKVSRMVVEALSLHLPEALGLWLAGDEQEPMQCAAARVMARDGKLSPEVAIVDTPTSTVLASGTVTLDTEALDLTLVSRPKTMSVLSLRTPIKLGGHLADPDISLASNPLGVKVLGALALSTVAPLAAIVPLIDMGSGKGRDGCEKALQVLERTPPAAVRR